MSNDLSSLHALQRVAVHIVARARQQATGRFSLRVAPGGFGTPEFGPDARRVRVAGTRLIVESDATGAASAVGQQIPGSSLRELAELARVDLTVPLDVGHDTPELGDLDAPIEIAAPTAASIHDWFDLVAAALDRVVADLSSDAGATLARLWPEHFDVALDAAAGDGIRVNLGGSPGDGFSAEPYLYVGPWTSDRPGDAAYWNAPFGAVRLRSELGAADPDAEAAEFLLAGYRSLAEGSHS